MKKPLPLSIRLVAYLLIAQIVALLLVPLTSFFIGTVGLDPEADVYWNDWGESRARELVANSIVREPGGAIRIEPTEPLRAYIAENPEFRYAAFDSATGVPARDSSADLASMLGEMTRLRANYLSFQILGASNRQLVGSFRKSSSPIGLTPIAVYGYSVQWPDVISLAFSWFTAPNILGLSPIIFGGVVIAWLMVRRSLMPLRVAAEAVSQIDMNSLDQRVPETNLPAEVVPFVQAVNQALSRLDVGVEAQRRFTANAAHELRTPVAILRARMNHPDDAFFISDIKRDARRIQTIVEQLLIAARISSRESALNEQVDLGETILAMVADYLPLVIESRRRIEYEPPPQPALVKGNRRALECIVANLIDNALRVEPEGGTVLVRVSEVSRIEVIDHGPGVRPEDRERVFEPFWRKDETTPGTGLGLSIVRELVETLGGTVAIDATPGGGATFRVSL